MRAYQVWLLVILGALGAYELIAAVANRYPTISEQVWHGPFWLMLGTVIGLGFLVYHFIRGWVRIHRPKDPSQ